MSDSVLKKFGKYFLLDRIGEGGMAEIFRARLATKDGSGRLLVIKRILGANSNNPEFVQMFKSEVQVTMRFSHPNIVQLYEAGDEENQQYIAMEFVDGRNLRQVLSKLAQKHQRLPVPIVCSLIEQAANGLHYAHTFKDRISGVPLNLVHRDVSPQNILISYDGNVKVIDFGIAKAATNGEATRAGVIKGKLSYLSPEQVMGEKLDGRSDLFALGIVMWELLTGKRLFAAEGDNEFQVLKMIESCNTFVKAPSALNKEVAKELDQIVLQILTRDPSKRFQTGDDLARALRKFLTTHYPDFGTADISIFVKKLFHEHIVEDRKSLQQLNSRAEELISLGSLPPKPVEPPVADAVEEAKEHTTVTQFMGNKFDRSQITMADQMEVAGKPHRQVRVAPGQKNTPYSASGTRKNQYTHPVPVSESSATGGSIFRGVASVAFLAACAGGGYWYWANMMNYGKVIVDELRKPATHTEPMVNTSSRQITLRLNLYPDGDLGNTRITVNSLPVDSANRRVAVAVGEPIEVRVERPGYNTYKQEFSLKETEVGDSKTWDKDIRLEPMKFGKLTLDSVPSFADVKVIRMDGEGRTPGSQSETLILKTPFMGEKLPAGNYRVLIENKALGMEKSITITVEEGKEIRPPDVHLTVKKNGF